MLPTARAVHVQYGVANTVCLHCPEQHPCLISTGAVENPFQRANELKRDNMSRDKRSVVTKPCFYAYASPVLLPMPSTVRSTRTRLGENNNQTRFFVRQARQSSDNELSQMDNAQCSPLPTLKVVGHLISMLTSPRAGYGVQVQFWLRRTYTTRAVWGNPHHAARLGAPGHPSWHPRRRSSVGT